jgi:hypothetical protein
MQLQAWYTELFAAFSILKQQYAKLQQERDEVEQQYQHLCDGWRQELEQKQAAFDNARSSILSQRCGIPTASSCAVPKEAMRHSEFVQFAEMWSSCVHTLHRKQKSH